MDTLSIITLAAAAPGALPGPLTQEAMRLTRAVSPRVLAEAEAVEWASPLPPDEARDALPAEALAAARIDLFVQPAGLPRRKRLLISDMDSTMVDGETLDQLAAAYGHGEEVAALSHASIDGSIDFDTSLRQRVAFLRGMETAMIEEMARSIRLNQDAALLVGTMRAHGALTVLISGGLTLLTRHTAALAGFDTHHGNEALIENGRLTGAVRDPILGPGSKQELMLAHAERLGLTEADALAIGDGANDLPMLHAAGLGIAFRASPAVASVIPNRIVHGTFRAALFAQGYSL